MATQVHLGRPVLQLGRPIDADARAAILLHGRGSTARAMAPLAEAIDPGRTSFLIPQAAGNRWYPYSAFEPLARNEPDLSAALALIAGLVDDLGRQGVAPGRIVLGGFSQGACLAAEFVARHPAGYGGLFVLSGALIGPPGMPRDVPGSLAGVPVFIGSSDVDPWVAQERVLETGRALRAMGARVDLRIYPGLGHTVNQDEIEAVRRLLAGV